MKKTEKKCKHFWQPVDYQKPKAFGYGVNDYLLLVCAYCLVATYIIPKDNSLYKK